MTPVSDTWRRRWPLSAVVAVLLCCAAPLLVAAGVATSVGVLLRNLLAIAVGVGLVAWAVWRAARVGPSAGPDVVSSDEAGG